MPPRSLLSALLQKLDVVKEFVIADRLDDHMTSNASQHDIVTMIRVMPTIVRELKYQEI